MTTPEHQPDPYQGSDEVAFVSVANISSFPSQRYRTVYAIHFGTPTPENRDFELGEISKIVEGHTLEGCNDVTYLGSTIESYGVEAACSRHENTIIVRQSWNEAVEEADRALNPRPKRNLSTCFAQTLVVRLFPWTQKETPYRQR